MQKRTPLLLLPALLASSLAAQTPIDLQEGVELFQQAHPRARISGAHFQAQTGPDDEVGTSTTIYGATLSVGASPLESAWDHVAEIEGVIGTRIDELVPAVQEDGSTTIGVMFDRATGEYRFSTFRFDQVLDGIPVFRSGVGFLVRNEPDHPLVMSTFDVKDLSGVDTTLAEVAREQGAAGYVLAAARQRLDQELAARALQVPLQPAELEASEEELVIWAGVDGDAAPPTLAMKFVATRGSVHVAPAAFQRHLFLVSVATGELLYSENLVEEFIDVNGTVTGRATDGLNTLECDPETEVPLPYIEANVVGGNSTFADVNGQFTISHGGSSNVTVRSRLRGQYFEVFDDTNGQQIPQVTTSVLPPGPANLVHNPTPGQEFPTAGVNAYLEANVVRDYTLSYAPNFPTIANQTFFDLIVNEDSFSGITSCNAVYTGSSCVFWRNAGGCNNTSFSDVVHHEYGHHLVNVTNNGQGAFGEGSGDCMGVLIQDDPVLGQGFSNCNQGIRNANNNLQYPCNGGIHHCGQLLSGCVWDLRNELIQTEPANYRDIGASLFINMLIVRGQMHPGNSTVGPEITIIYLELDDDDGNIGNGTPHYGEIAAAFGSHNLDAPPLELIDFAYPGGRPDSVDLDGGEIEFTVAVTGINGTPAAGTGVLHVNRGNGFETFPMSEESPNVYEAVFPAVDCTQNVRYYVSAETTGGETVSDPDGAPQDRFETIGASSATETFADDFETSTGWTVSGDATDGQWGRGVPAGGGDRGDPPTDSDGSGSCYVTDNVAGNSDVDGGSTILTSPILDASSASGEALVSYHRWYSNTFGASPMADVFVVEISNDSGSSWVELETVGPAGSEVNGGWIEKSFLVSNFLTPTSTMRLRFTASDLGDGSVVEAGVDGVRILSVECNFDCNSNGIEDATDILIGNSHDTNGNGIPDECEGLVTTYCTAGPNSVSVLGGYMSHSGSIVVSDNNLSLSASPVPNTIGLFFFGPNQTSVPFGQGFRCVANPLVRLSPPTFVSGNVATRVLDFQGSGNENQISAGDTANFQFWFRDPNGGAPPNDFSLSDGLQITFPLE